ncbi:MAG: hypothetical protein N2C14_14800 [Planctomycetales bacterium]
MEDPHNSTNEGDCRLLDGPFIPVSSLFDCIRGQRVFGCAELPRNELVFVGNTNGWVAFRVGSWTLWLEIARHQGEFAIFFLVDALTRLT